MSDSPLNVIYVGEDPETYRLVTESLAQAPGHGLELLRFDRVDQAMEHNEKHRADALLLDLARSDFTEEISMSALPSLFPDLSVVVLLGAEPDGKTSQAMESVTQNYLFTDKLTGPMVTHAVRRAVRQKAAQSRMAHTREALESWVEQRTRDLSRTNKALLKEIEERKRVQQDLVESRRMLGMITDNIPALVAFVDKDRCYRFVNRRYEEYLNRSRKDVLDKHASEVLGERYENHARKYIDRTLNGEATDYEMEFTIPGVERKRWLHIAYIPSFTGSGEVDGYFVLGNDITERKQSENTLREHRELLQNILDGMGAAVLHIDVEDFRIIDVNEIAEHLLGLSREEIMSKKCHELICRKEGSVNGEECLAVQGKSLNTEITLKRSDGQLVPVTRSVLPVTIFGRQRHVVILFDITERKAMERQLAFAQKLESVGQLAAGIAHEINTPIQYIGNNLHFLKDIYEHIAKVLAAYPELTSCLEADQDARECLREAAANIEGVDLASLMSEVPQALKESLEGVERVAGIVLAMKKFSHPDVESWKHVSLNEAVRSTVTITRNEWKHVADMELDLEEGLPTVSVVPGDINQVILNLLINAAHAIRDKVGDGGDLGTITIRTRMPDPDRVELSVADTGTGIPEKDRSRVFDPFFTTKEVGKGTGQGLAIALSVVEKHDGSIDFESSEGEGTTFFVRLPIEHKNGEQ